MNFDSVRTVQNALHMIKEYLNMAIMPLTLQRVKVLRYCPPAGQSQTVTTQTIVQMFHEVSGFVITPNKVLITCLLNTIQDKYLIIKVQEQITEHMDLEQVRNTRWIEPHICKTATRKKIGCGQVEPNPKHAEHAEKRVI